MIFFDYINQGKIEFTNPSEGSELIFQIDGVHFPANGTFVGFAIPRGLVSFTFTPIIFLVSLTMMARHFSDLRELPSLVPSYIRNATAQAVAPELDRRITRLNNMIDSGTIDTDSNSNGTSYWCTSGCFWCPANLEISFQVSLGFRLATSHSIFN